MNVRFTVWFLAISLAIVCGCYQASSKQAAPEVVQPSEKTPPSPEPSPQDTLIAKATTAIEKNPKECDARSESVFHQRAKAYLAKGDDDKAISDLSEAIRLYPTLPTPYWPARFVEAYDARAKCYERKKEFEKAIADYSEIIRMGTGGFSDLGMAMVFSGFAANSYYRRGLLHDANGNHEQAMSDFKAAARIAPELLETNPDLKKRVGDGKP